jgi:hypothetical protein
MSLWQHWQQLCNSLENLAKVLGESADKFAVPDAKGILQYG